MAVHATPPHSLLAEVALPHEPRPDDASGRCVHNVVRWLRDGLSLRLRRPAPLGAHGCRQAQRWPGRTRRKQARDEQLRNPRTGHHVLGNGCTTSRHAHRCARECWTATVRAQSGYLPARPGQRTAQHELQGSLDGCVLSGRALPQAPWPVRLHQCESLCMHASWVLVHTHGHGAAAGQAAWHHRPAQCVPERAKVVHRPPCMRISAQSAHSAVPPTLQGARARPDRAPGDAGGTPRPYGGHRCLQAVLCAPGERAGRIRASGLRCAQTRRFGRV